MAKVLDGATEAHWAVRSETYLGVASMKSMA